MSIETWFYYYEFLFAIVGCIFLLCVGFILAFGVLLISLGGLSILCYKCLCKYREKLEEELEKEKEIVVVRYNPCDDKVTHGSSRKELLNKLDILLDPRTAAAEV